MAIYFECIDQQSYGGYFEKTDNPILSGVGYVVNSIPFSIATLAPLHVFCHEFGHAVAYILLTGGSVTIKLISPYCSGLTEYKDCHTLSTWKETIVDLAGPLADIILSVAMIYAAFVLTQAFLLSYAVALSLKIVLGGSGVIWITGEFLYATVSTLRLDHGDFGKIAAKGPLHFLVSTAVIVSVLGIGTFAILAL